MIQIIGSRRSGRTTELIKLCKRLNDESGHNDTIIVTADLHRAKIIQRMAEDLGCGDIPMPAPIGSLIKQPATFYKRVLIDDMEHAVQHLLGQWELSGYVVQGPERIDEFCRMGWISVHEIKPGGAS